jgi:N-acetyl-gamma-glutamyl-phosphate reductase
VDAASGISGGGRDPVRAFHYPECADSISPYKVGAHRHTPEIRRNLEAVPGRKVLPQVIFTPHLAPMNRGILCTTYIPLAENRRPPGTGRDSSRPPGEAVGEKVREIREFYAGFYREEPFIRVLPPGLAASTGRLRQSNFCDISVHLDPAGTTRILVSAIDNVVQGAAGQAVQNMNIIFGFAETAGLEAIPASC